MIKHYLSTLILASCITALSATDHTIVIEGITFSPSNLTVQVGDNVTIVTSAVHPTREVSEATWNMNGSTELAGGFGTFTEPFTISIADTDPIFYVCTIHVGAEMKGQINVEPSNIGENVNLIEVNLGVLPVANGQLDYSISSDHALNGTFEVMAINGQVMARKTISSMTGTLPTPFARGIYVAIIRDEKGELLYRRSISIE